MRVMGRQWQSLLISLLVVAILTETADSFESSFMFLATRRGLLARTFPLASFISESAKKMSSSSLGATRLHEISEGLVNENIKHDDTGSFHACLVVAGGGGQAISALSSTPGASAFLLEGTVTYHRNSFLNYIESSDGKNDDSFVSEEMAQELSRAALNRALKYVPDVKSYSKCVGVACTSALLKPNGRKGRTSRGHVCATMMNGKQWSCNVTLGNGRSRHEEDALMGCLILEGTQQLLFPRANPNEFNYLKSSEGDKAHVSLKCLASNAYEESVISSAERILSEETKAALLVPVQSVFVQAPNVILPSNKPTLIFPGSFNPPHQGHLALAQAAIDVVQEETGLDDLSVLMEVSLTNADKPPIMPQEVSRRAHLFFSLAKDLLPNSWGILLTSAPLFQQKVQLIREAGNTGELIFVIGTDTMVRIINPKYYGNSQDNMLAAVRDMKQLGVRYVVGGRLEQGQDQGAFVTGQEELESLPADIQEMFLLVREEDFRVDISSTELRRKAETSAAS